MPPAIHVPASGLKQVSFEMDQQDLQSNPFQSPATTDVGGLDPSRFEKSNGFEWLLIAVAAFVGLALFLVA